MNAVLQRSPKALQIQVRIILISAAIVGLIAGILVRISVDFFYDQYHLSGILTFLFVMTLAWIAILFMQKTWNNTHYELGPDALLVTSDRGLFGTEQDVYLYESIISVNFTQGMAGKRYGYGDMRVVIPKLGSELILRDIIDPVQQLPVFKSRIEDKSATPKALVT